MAHSTVASSASSLRLPTNPGQTRNDDHTAIDSSASSLRLASDLVPSGQTRNGDDDVDLFQLDDDDDGSADYRCASNSSIDSDDDSNDCSASLSQNGGDVLDSCDDHRGSSATDDSSLSDIDSADDSDNSGSMVQSDDDSDDAAPTLTRSECYLTVRQLPASDLFLVVKKGGTGWTPIRNKDKFVHRPSLEQVGVNWAPDLEQK